MTLVRIGWCYRVLSSGVSADSGLEVLCVQVMDGKGGIWNTVNVYVLCSRDLTSVKEWRVS